ncbi:MAG: putative peptide transporter, permease protein, partial [Rhizobacter sp.]|nr:putative peptide transporter, permease protein [Rhizobacter sp.]
MPTETRPVPSSPGLITRFRASDLGWSLTHSPRAMVSLAVVVLLVLASLLAPWISPQNPLDLASLDLGAALTPPAWIDGGSATYPLGTDGQGRDLL